MRRKSVKIRIMTVMLSVVISTGMIPFTAFGASYLPDLSDKSIYYTSDYRSGDCVLSSAKSMLRRAAIMKGSYSWDSITNTAIRSTATIGGTSFRNSFTYKKDGISYSVVNQSLSGSAAKKLKDIKALLNNHPEGVIVWGKGAATSGTHGVLATGYSGDTLYAVDSTNNTYSVNKGIQKWGSTTMKSLDHCTETWYISSIKGGAAAKPASGESTLSAAGIREPSVINEGAAFSIMGTVESNYRITDVTVTVISAAGKAVINKSASPGTSRYSINSLDSSVKFGALAAGEYIYRITATDEKKGPEILHENQFTIKAKSAASTTTAAAAAAVSVSDASDTATDTEDLPKAASKPNVLEVKGIKISSVRVPYALSEGGKFTFMGNIKSSKKIKAVRVQVLNAKGKCVQSAGAKPGKKTYSIKKLDPKIRFGTLKKGRYIFRVKVKTGSTWKELIRQDFTVR